MEPQELPQEVTEIVQLIEKYLKKEITAEEKILLNNWINLSRENQELFKNLTTERGQHELMQQFHRSEQIMEGVQGDAKELVFGTTTPVEKIYSVLKKVAIAAAVVLAVSGTYFWYAQKEEHKPQVSVPRRDLNNDLPPGQYKAMLTLSDGSRVRLDSVATGKLAEQGGIKVLNKEGQLLYEPTTSASTKVLYNTLSTSRGEMYPVVLSDGSHVWLNSASSIHYPVVFPSNERKVEITGEAYFEVAKDAKKPFIISVHGTEVRVLGTHLNINAYTDDAKIRTTLLEGSVKITPAGGAKPEMLKPGQQAQVSASGVITLVNNVDTEEVVAWRNGYFQFNGQGVKAIMLQLERWYDVEVVFEGNVPDGRFAGKIPRNANASKVLNMLQQSGIHFRIEGKKIIVTP